MNVGGAKRELRMDGICCSAHGLPLVITAVKGDQKHTLLFDTGPEEYAWERNAKRLRADIKTIEAIHLSHWHHGHSGGMLKALQMINHAKETSDPLSVDLHPSCPDYRGIMAMEPTPWKPTRPSTRLKPPGAKWKRMTGQIVS